MTTLYNTHQVTKHCWQKGWVDAPPSRKTSYFYYTNIDHICFLDRRLNIIREALERDQIHNRLYHLRHGRWPAISHQVSGVAWHFWETRDKLSVDNGLLLKGMRIVIILKWWQILYLLYRCYSISSSCTMFRCSMLSNKCRVNACTSEVHVYYIEWDLLAATCTASAFALIGWAAGYAGVHAWAESVHQNCVLRRCANLCSIVVLQLPSLFIFGGDLTRGKFNTYWN